jgi:hypothetical protein
VQNVGKESGKMEEMMMMMLMMMITSVISHKLTPSHRSVKPVEPGTRAEDNNEKNITLILHGQFEAGG